MKYSVLMSVYIKDHPQHLKLALESIYDNQTRKPDEIIVVFDGPLTDGLYGVLDEFRNGKEEFVFYYPQEVNRGLGEALKIGASKCSGDYIFRMDSDDISIPERFEKQIEFLEKNPEVGLVGSAITEFNDDPGVILRKRICPLSHDDVVKMAKKRNPINHMTVCMKRSELEKCGGYRTLLLSEDYYLWLRMIVSGCRVANMEECLVNVRIGNGFDERRGSKVRLKGWFYLQKYMLENKLINHFEAFMNYVYILGFTYCPKFVRKFAYKHFLRK